MLSSVARTGLIFALCLSIGGHWVVLQPVAWATMILDYSQHASLAKAVAETFDGNHPCDLCKHISGVQRSQKKPDVQPVTLKPDLICATRGIVLFPPSMDLSFVGVKFGTLARVHSPPVPPPRSELV